MTDLTRRKVLVGAAATAMAAGVAVTARAASFGNPDRPPEGAVNALNRQGLTDPGPQNPALANQFPTFQNPPPTDVNAKHALSDPNKSVKIADAKLSLLFGKIEISLARDVADGVRWVHYILATRVAETLGVLLSLIWTAGFLPAFLHPSAVTVLLAKPTPRWKLLVGKSLGILAFVAIHATAFVFLTWSALGSRAPSNRASTR